MLKMRASEEKMMSASARIPCVCGGKTDEINIYDDQLRELDLRLLDLGATQSTSRMVRGVRTRFSREALVLGLSNLLPKTTTHQTRKENKNLT